jgi:hypothetical protein
MNKKIMVPLLGGLLLLLFIYIYIISTVCVEGFSKQEKEAIIQRRAARAIADEADKQWQAMLDEVK